MNTYEEVEAECLAYLESQSWKDFDPPGKPVHGSLYTIADGQVTLGKGLFFFIQRLFNSYLTDEERADPWGLQSHLSG